MLHCDHKPLEPFLSKGFKIPKINRWSLGLTDYSITFIYIKGKHNILADAISRLKILNIYKELLGYLQVQVVNNTQYVVTKVCVTSMHTVGTDILWSEQKWDKMCKKQASQIHHSKKNSSKSFTLSADGVLQKHQYIHGLQHNITIASCSLVPTILLQFHDINVIREPFVHLR